MLGFSDNLDEFLGQLLRGVAKITGCNSCNLIVFNETTGELSVRAGIPQMSYPDLKEVEDVLGENLRGLSVPMAQAEGSLLYEVYRDGGVVENSSLAELLGDTLPKEMLEQFDTLIGAHRFLLAPVRSASRSYGVVLYEKSGEEAFTRQQRELFLHYARRVGRIIQHGIMGADSPRKERTERERSELRFFDAEGQLCGEGSGTGTPAGGTTLSSLGEQARRFLESGKVEARGEVSKDGQFDLRLRRIEVGGQKLAMCALTPRVVPGESTVERQLLQLSLAEAAPSVFLDAECRITSCNRATEKLLGMPVAEFQGRMVAELFRDPEAVELLVGQKFLQGANVSQEVSALLRHQDGSLIPVQVEIVMLAEDTDDVVGFLMLLRPREGEQRFTPEQLVRQEKLATMGEMAAQLAHEIRNPILAIGATLESLSQDDLAERPKHLISLAAQEIGRIDMILKKYLSVRSVGSRTMVGMRGLVEEVRGLLSGARRIAGKRIDNQVPEDCRIPGDADALRHVIFNLLLNALEVTPAGGEVLCRADCGEKDVSILVEDRGSGLKATAAECLQPFFTTKANGTGLGLAVCQKIAQAHGGAVDLRDRPGGGCQAMLVLPVNRAGDDS
ncbi:MAG: GAF domain-containing protein [Deltaproteobacteria bacterium]|nr:GAF domain-containing protein [Deltaproteobacteria bacterium]